MIARRTDLDCFALLEAGGPYFDYEGPRGIPLEMLQAGPAGHLDKPEGTVTIRVSATLFAEMLAAWKASKGIAS